jgi:threonine aldolase
VDDFLSDTVTKPTPGMRAAMVAAEVGDDVFGEDPTLNALQERVAALFGHEAALFTPSGTMANQVALQTLLSPGDGLLCEYDAHILAYEAGAASMLGGITTRTWSGEFAPGLIREAGYYHAPTRAIAVEQTHNVNAGAITSLSTLEAISATGLPVHCDGARIWNAHVATGIPLATYGRLFTTISVCLSKGLGAPVGSLVIGSAELIGRARLTRKRLGGGMRQAGFLAAAGLYALDHHIDRMAVDHERAGRIAEALQPWSRWGGTNIVYLDLEVDAPPVAEQALAIGVRAGPRTIRMITHLDVDDAAVDRAIDALRKIIPGAR